MKRALIVDHDRASRENLAKNLGCWGYQVVVAADGDEAWEILEEAGAPKIVLVDSAVPGVSALELCRRVRDVRGDDGFVFILGRSEGSSELEAFEAGADGVIPKPVHLRALRMRLTAGLRGRRLAVSDAPKGHVIEEPVDQPLSGRVLAGKYSVDRLIGRGGMGTVWQGTHVGLGVKVAIKFIKAEYARLPAARARFELEARAAARLRTKYAVKVFDCGVTDDGLPYMVMEFLEGLSLLEYVDQNGPLTFSETVTLVTQVAHALSQLHESGTIHRDVKPDNIVIVDDPDATQEKRRRIAKVIDFGVAKVLAQEEGGGPLACGTQRGTFVGTPNYMSPEQLSGTSGPDIGADLWALAACAFTAMTGRIPFEGGTLGTVIRKVCAEPLPIPSQIRFGVPPEFDRWFARACERDPSKRFASARELARALTEAHHDYTDSS
ncbi:MAG TPA: protein kinase, partial [Polyangiaceae bacterium]